MSEDVTDGFQFRESSLRDPFDFIFTGSDEVTKGFSFSGNISEVSDVLRDRELVRASFSSVLVFLKESLTKLEIRKE